MTLQNLTTQGLVYPWNWPDSNTSPVLGDTTANDATGEKTAFTGHVWFAERTGTKDITRVGFLFGTITKSGGSGLTVSLQDPLLTGTGSLAVPNEAQDETVAIANGNASFASNTWMRTGALSANRTVSYGDRLSVVVEYDGSGRINPDSFTLSCPAIAVVSLPMVAVKTGGGPSWGAVNRLPNVVLEFTDGTFGTLYGSLPASAIGTLSPTVSSSPDEYGLELSMPFLCKAEGYWAHLAAGNARDFEIATYQDAATTALTGSTMVFDGQITSVSGFRIDAPGTAAFTMIPNIKYILGVRATGTSATTIYQVTVNDAKHKVCWGVPEAGGVRSRTDVGGAWGAVDTTKLLILGWRIGSLLGGPRTMSRIGI